MEFTQNQADIILSALIHLKKTARLLPENGWQEKDSETIDDLIKMEFSIKDK